jgi:hypothetical protein
MNKVWSVTVNCRHGESNSSRATDQVAFANVLPQMLQNFAVKLCVDGLALWDEFAMNNAADVKKRRVWSSLSCGSFPPSSVVEMMESSIVTTAALSQGHTHG